MRFATRKPVDTSLAALATRLYAPPDQARQAAAEAALLAANPVLADLTQVPVGTALIAPTVPGTSFGPEARGADELAFAASADLLRVVDDVVAQLDEDFSDDAADAGPSTNPYDVPQANPARNNWAAFLATVGPAAQARHDASVIGRDTAAAKFAPLKADLAALLARLR